MEVREDDPAAAVAWLERRYHEWRVVTGSIVGEQDSWLPGLYRTFVEYSAGDFIPRGDMFFQPMFTIKEDSARDEDGIYTCSLCLHGNRHRCWGCGRFSRHMADDECVNCWDLNLASIARRPPEEDPQ